MVPKPSLFPLSPVYSLCTTYCALLFESLSPNSETFTGGWKVNFSRRAVFSKVRCTAELTVATILSVLYFKIFLCSQFDKNKNLKNETTFAFYIENICRLIWKPWNQTFSPAVIQKSLRIRAMNASLLHNRLSTLWSLFR